LFSPRRREEREESRSVIKISTSRLLDVTLFFFAALAPCGSKKALMIFKLSSQNVSIVSKMRMKKTPDIDFPEVNNLNSGYLVHSAIQVRPDTGMCHPGQAKRCAGISSFLARA